MNAGLLRKGASDGHSELLVNELHILRSGVLHARAGDRHELFSGERELGMLLIRGACEIVTEAGRVALGPRHDPLRERPWALLVGRGRTVTVHATESCVLGLASAPSKWDGPGYFIHPEHTGGGPRGEGCFRREVRFAIWNDNSPGEQLMMGETVIPPGHWSTFPPHKHDAFSEGMETAYEEAFYFEFEAPNGFALVRQYDLRGFDQTVCAKSGDTAYFGAGYHSLVNSPVGWAYQMTMLAGPARMSLASLDPNFSGAANPYRDQRTKK